jgi:hypothetical protein
MPRGLKNDLQIWKLARDLDLPAREDPLGEIIEYCLKWTRDVLRMCPCDSLSELLENAATKLETIFREVHTDEDLLEVRNEFLRRGEKEFALVDHELGPGCFAITFRLLNPKLGERPYISVIDCRGDKIYRAYYSKWHELAHLITLTDQQRFKFCRTHSALNKKDPEEALMEVIAGQLGFLPDMVRRYAKGSISFEKINEVKQALCPEASAQASTIGIARGWPTACVLLEARLEYKSSDRAKLNQNRFDFVNPPTAELRVSHVSSSPAAEGFAQRLHKNMRVSARSAIYKVFHGDVLSVDGEREDLSWWETKKGGHLLASPFIVSARKRGDSVQALLVPVIRERQSSH